MNPVSLRHRLWLIALLVFWAVYGMTGRDAWLADEALILGDILDWQTHGRLPMDAVSPLYTLLTGLGAKILQPWLDLQDGARLASALFTLAALGLTGLTGRELFGRGGGSVAVLALAGAFGLLLRAHALLPGVALLAGYALLLYGVAIARRNARYSAAAIGLAMAALLLLRGVPDLIAGLLIAALPLLSRDWRTPAYRAALARSLLWLAGGLSVCLAWLTWQAPQALQVWWLQATAYLLPNRSPTSLLNLLAWFAWPLWPLALWTVWNEHRRLGRTSVLHPLLGAVLILLPLALWPGHSRDGGALPVLVPLALLAAHGTETLKRGAAQSFYWFGVLCFLFFTLAFWIYFAAIEWGWPGPIARHMARLTPSYQAGAVSASAIMVAVIATLMWITAIPLFPRAKARPILVWATGMLLTWVLLVSLFKPWAEESWGYRPLVVQLSAVLPSDACLSAQVDPAMGVMLRYYLRERYRGAETCRYTLILSEPGSAADTADGAPAWSGYRPRYKDAIYRLYDHGG